VSIQILRPNGVGAATGWDFPLFAAHWEQVDEITQDGNTTCIDDDGVTIPNGSNECDIFTLDSWTHGTQHVEKIEVVFWGRLNEGSGKIAPLVYLNGAMTHGSTETLTGSWAEYTQELSRPNGGNWHWTDLGTLQIGVESSSGGGSKMGNNIKCTQIYVKVTYSPYFAEINAIGHVAPLFTEPKLILTDSNSDLEEPGDDFDKKLLRVTDGMTELMSTVNPGETETSYFYTEANDPYNDDWETGPWIVTIKPYGDAASGLHLRVRITRISNDGTPLEYSDWSEWKDAPWYDMTPFILEIAGKDWTAGMRSNRLRLDFQYSHTGVGLGIFGIRVNDDSSFISTTVHQGRSDIMDATGHVLQERSDAIDAIGHILQGRSDIMDATGHVLQERSDAIDAIGHILQGRSDIMDATGHVESAPSPSPSPSPSPPPSPETREDSIDVTGHTLQKRSDAVDATGHTTQRRLDTMSATGHIAGDVKRKLFLFDVALFERLKKLLFEMEKKRRKDDKDAQRGFMA